MYRRDSREQSVLDLREWWIRGFELQCLGGLTRWEMGERWLRR